MAIQRTVVGFHQDEAGDWVAALDCGHGVHVRHNPPFMNRPWVVSEAGRRAALGEPRDCVRCERLEWPEGLTPYKRTPEFTAASIPPGLLKDHASRAGVWGKIHVTQGRLTYRVADLDGREMVLDANTPGIIAPALRHRVAPLGDVRFYVEFYRKQ